MFKKNLIMKDAPSQLPPNVIIYKKSLNARELQARLARLIETFDTLPANEVTK